MTGIVMANCQSDQRVNSGVSTTVRSDKNRQVKNPMRHFIIRLAKEPLVQFLALGAFVFMLDHYVFVNTDNPRRITLDDARFQELVGIFETERGRSPTEEEIEQMLVTWTQNEIMYREALTMGLDRGDEMIRSRMILKLRDIVFNNIIIDFPPDEELRAWFEEHRAAYDRPELIDFEQFPVQDIGQEEARALAAELGSQDHPAEYDRVFRSYDTRIPDNLFSVFEKDDARAILDAPSGQWVAARSDYGLHLARITDRSAAQPVTFEEARALVKEDWYAQERERQIADALGEIVAEYQISYDFTRDLVERSLASIEPERVAAPQ
jgi:hypothetical protein